MTTLQVLENWLSPALVRAIGYTLLHSLWQGAALAGLLAAALPLLRRARPELRYAASAGALLGLLLLAGGTFGYYYSHPPLYVQLPSESVRYELVLLAPATAPAASAPSALLPTLARRCEPYLPVLVAAWLLGLLLMGARLAGGLLVAGRLRRVDVQAVGEGWQRRLRELAARAGLRRPVTLLESARVRGPLVLGHLRPVVLLPLGALAGLPPAQLDALLAHELAHIVRRDYLLNLGLAVVEVLFFYHPAAWFMAACLRTERENCCDDQAAQLVGGNRLLVAQALAALAELEAVAPAGPRLALAAAGSAGRRSLLARVRRLALGHTQAPTLREGLLAGLLCLLGIAGLGTTLAAARPAQQLAPAPADTSRSQAPALPQGEASSLAVRPPADTIRGRVESRRERSQVLRFGPSSPSTIVLEKDKKGRVKSLTVDGQPVPTGEPDKKVKRSKKGETVTIIEAPGTSPRPDGWGTNRGWSSAPNRGWSSQSANPDGWGFSADAATEARRQAHQRLQQTLRDPQLPADQRQMLEQSLQQLDAAGADTWSYRRLPTPRTYTYQFPQLKTLRGWGSQQFKSFGPADQQQLQQSARELARQSEQFEQQSRQTQRELAQAQRELERAQLDMQSAQRDAQRALRQQPDLRLHGQALQNLSESQRRLNEGSQRLWREAGTAQRRAQLQARIAAAQAELDALEDQEEVSALAEAGPHLPKPPRAPKLPAQTAPAPPAPPAPPAQARPVPPPPPPPAPADVRNELRRDGLIGKNDKRFRLQITDQTGSVNGHALTAEQVRKYRSLLGHEDTKDHTELRMDFNEK